MSSILLLHIFVAFIAICFAQIGVRINEKNVIPLSLNLGSLLSFSLLLCFLGSRVFLGRDWFNYENVFSSPWEQDFSLGESSEFGFLLLMNFLRSFDFTFQSFIFVSSFLILFYFFLSYRKFFYLLPFGIFVFFVDWGYPVVINTIRQGIALMAFLNAALYIDSNEKYAGAKFLFFIFLGFLFHYTILLFLPFYFVGRIKLNISRFLGLCLLIYLLSILFVLPAYEETLGLVDKYEDYLGNKQIVNEKSTFGLGATLLLVIRSAPLLVYEYVREKYPTFLKFFVLYYIGLSIYYGFYDFLLIIRVTFYLQFFELFVLPFFMYYLFVEKKEYRLIGIVYVSLIIFNYVYTFRGFLVDHVMNSRFSMMFMDFYFKVQ